MEEEEELIKISEDAQESTVNWDKDLYGGGLHGLTEHQSIFDIIGETKLGTPNEHMYTFQNQDKYKDYTDPILNTNQDFLRANNQSAWEQAGASLKQAVVGEIIGGTLEGFGSIYQIGADLVAEAQGEDAQFENALTKIGANMREWSKDTSPIYRMNPNSAFNVGDSGWWFQHATSIASTFGLMIPGLAVVKGVSWIGKLAGLTARMGGTGSMLLEAAGMATVMRNGENFKEALGVVNSTKAELRQMLDTDEAFDAYIKSDEGTKVAQSLTSAGRAVDREEVINYISAAAGWRDYNLNAINVVSDFIQVLPMFNLAKGMSRGSLLKPHSLNTLKYQAEHAATSKMKAATIASGKKSLIRKGLMASRYNMKRMFRPGTIGFESGTEAGEELINAMSEKEGIRYGHVLMDKTTESERGDVSERIGEYLHDLFVWEQAFWGAIGGLAFASGARGIARLKGNQSKKTRDAMAQSEIAGRQVVFTAIEDQVNRYLKNEKQPYPVRNIRNQSILDKLTEEDNVLDDNGKATKEVYLSVEDIAANEDLSIEDVRYNQLERILVDSSEALADSSIQSGTVDLLIDDLRKGRLNELINKLRKDTGIAEKYTDLLTPEAMIKLIERREKSYNKLKNRIVTKNLPAYMKDLIIRRAVNAESAIANSDKAISRLDRQIAEETDISDIKKELAKDPNLTNKTELFGKSITIDHLQKQKKAYEKIGDKVSAREIDKIIEGLTKQIEQEVDLIEPDPAKAQELVNQLLFGDLLAAQSRLEAKGYAATTLKKIAEKEHHKALISLNEGKLADTNSNKKNKELQKEIEDDSNKYKNANLAKIKSYFNRFKTRADFGEDTEENYKRHVSQLLNEPMSKGSAQNVDVNAFDAEIREAYGKANKAILAAEKQEENTENNIKVISNETWDYFNDNNQLPDIVRDDIIQLIADRLISNINITEREKAIYDVYKSEIDNIVTPPSNKDTTLSKDNSIEQNTTNMFNGMADSVKVEIGTVIYGTKRPSDLMYASVLLRLYKKYLTPKDKKDIINSKRRVATILKEIDGLLQADVFDIERFAYLQREYLFKTNELETAVFSPGTIFNSAENKPLFAKLDDDVSTEGVTLQSDTETQATHLISAINESNWFIKKLEEQFNIKTFVYKKGTTATIGHTKEYVKLLKAAKANLAKNGTVTNADFVVLEIDKALLGIKNNKLTKGLNLNVRLATTQKNRGNNSPYIYAATGKTNYSSNDEQGEMVKHVEYTEEDKVKILNSLNFRIFNKSTQVPIHFRGSSVYKSSVNIMDDVLEVLEGYNLDEDTQIKPLISALYMEYVELAETYKSDEVEVIIPSFTKITNGAKDVESLVSTLEYWKQKMDKNYNNLKPISDLVKKALDAGMPINKIQLDNVTIAESTKLRPNYSYNSENELSSIFGEIDKNNIVIVGKKGVRLIQSRVDPTIVFNKSSKQQPFQQGVYYIHTKEASGPVLVRLRTKKLGETSRVTDNIDNIIEALTEEELDINLFATNLEDAIKPMTIVHNTKSAITVGVKVNTHARKNGSIDVMEWHVTTSNANGSVAEDGVIVDNVKTKVDVYTVRKKGTELSIYLNNKELKGNFADTLTTALGKLRVSVDLSTEQELSSSTTAVQNELVDRYYDSFITNVERFVMSDGSSTIFDLNPNNAHLNSAFKIQVDNASMNEKQVNYLNSGRREKGKNNVNFGKPISKDESTKNNLIRLSETNTFIDVFGTNTLTNFTKHIGGTLGAFIKDTYSDDIFSSKFGKLFSKHSDIKIVDKRSEGVEAIFQYEPSTNELYVHSMYDSAKNIANIDSILDRLIIHELIHAEINTNANISTIYSELTKIQDYLKDNSKQVYNVGQQLGIPENIIKSLLEGSVEELITYTFSDTRILELLGNIKSMNGTKTTSLLDKLFNLIAKVLKELGVKSDTILEDVATVMVTNNIAIFGSSENITSTNDETGETDSTTINTNRSRLPNFAILDGVQITETNPSTFVEEGFKVTPTQEEEDNRCTGFRTAKAANGYRNGLGNGKWALVKDLKGYKPHSKGGVDLKIDNGSVSILRGNSSIKAEHGLFIAAEGVVIPPDDPPTSTKQDETFNPTDDVDPASFDVDSYVNTPEFKATLEQSKLDRTKRDKARAEIPSLGTTPVNEKDVYGDGYFNMIDEVEVTAKAGDRKKFYTDEYEKENKYEPYVNDNLNKLYPDRVKRIDDERRASYDKLRDSDVSISLDTERRLAEVPESFKNSISGMNDTEADRESMINIQDKMQKEWASKSTAEKIGHYGIEAALAIAPELAMLKGGKFIKAINDARKSTNIKKGVNTLSNITKSTKDKVSSIYNKTKDAYNKTKDAYNNNVDDGLLNIIDKQIADKPLTKLEEFRVYLHNNKLTKALNERKDELSIGRDGNLSKLGNVNNDITKLNDVKSSSNVRYYIPEEFSNQAGYATFLDSKGLLKNAVDNPQKYFNDAELVDEFLETYLSMNRGIVVPIGLNKADKIQFIEDALKIGKSGRLGAGSYHGNSAGTLHTFSTNLTGNTEGIMADTYLNLPGMAAAKTPSEKLKIIEKYIDVDTNIAIKRAQGKVDADLHTPAELTTYGKLSKEELGGTSYSDALVAEGQYNGLKFAERRIDKEFALNNPDIIKIRKVVSNRTIDGDIESKYGYMGLKDFNSDPDRWYNYNADIVNELKKHTKHIEDIDTKARVDKLISELKGIKVSKNTKLSDIELDLTTEQGRLMSNIRSADDGMDMVSKINKLNSNIKDNMKHIISNVSQYVALGGSLAAVGDYMLSTEAERTGTKSLFDEINKDDVIYENKYDRHTDKDNFDKAEDYKYKMHDYYVDLIDAGMSKNKAITVVTNIIKENNNNE